jgi:uncharacterized protein (DUF433 family)
MEPIITRNPKIMHGTPCFAGTRVAVQTFFDHLEAGYTINGFLEQFPTVRREQVSRLLKILRQDALYNVPNRPFRGVGQKGIGSPGTRSSLALFPVPRASPRL